MWNTLKKFISGPAGKKQQDLFKSNFLPNDFTLTNLSECFGSPSRATKLAFDPIQKICAIGSASGIRIFGKAGVEATLKTDITSPLLQLFFVVNEGVLVCVYEKAIQTWNLAERKVITTKTFNEGCTCASYSVGSKFLLLGDVKGSVSAWNLESNYHIPNVASYLEYVQANTNVDTKMMPVIAIDVNPLDNTQILVAFENSVIALFDLNVRKATKFFGPGPAGITCMSFNRNGTKFATGHDSGVVTLFSIKDSTPKDSFHISDSESNRKPVTRLVWAKSKGENYLVLVGGSAAPGVPTLPAEGERIQPAQSREGIVVVSGKKLSKNSDRKRLWFIEPASGNMVDFTLGFNSPWPSQLERELQFMVSVTNTGKVMVHSLTKTGFIGMPAPSTQSLLGDPTSVIICSHVYKDCSASLFAVLRSTSQHKMHEDWPITGGSIPSSIPGRELLVTGHSDGKIHFWHADALSFAHLYTLSVSANLMEFEFSPSSGRLLVVFENVVQFYNLSVSARVIKTLVYDPTFSQQTTLPSQEATQAPSQPPSPTKAPPIQQPSSPGAQTEPPASQQTEQVSQNTEQRSQPNSPQQQNQVPQEAPQSPPKQQQPQTPQQPSSPQSPQPPQTQQQPQPQQPEQQQDQQTQSSEQTQSQSQSPQAQPPKQTIAFFRAPQHFSAGFQMEGEFFMGSNVMTVHISEDNRFVVGEENGYVACFSFHDDIEVPIKILSHKKITEGTAITYVGSFGPSQEFPSLSPQIVVGTQTGSIRTFDSSNHQPTATFRLTENSPIVYFQLVDKFGNPVSPRKEIATDPQSPTEEPITSSTGLATSPPRQIQISGENILPPAPTTTTLSSTPSSAPTSAPPSAPSSTPSSPAISPTPDTAQQTTTQPPTQPPSSSTSTQLALSSAPTSVSSTPSSSTPSSPVPTPQPIPSEIYAVVASEKEIHVFQRVLQEASEENPSRAPSPSESYVFERVSKVEVGKGKLYSVAIFKYFGNNEACLAAFDVSGGIVYTLLDLTKVQSMTHNSNVRFSPGAEGIIFGLHPEGVFKGSIFSAEFRPPPPTVFVQGLAAPAQPKTGVFKSLFGKQSAGLDELLGQRQQQQPQERIKETSETSNSGAPAQGTRSIEEIKAKYGKASSTADSLAQARQALGERGEKLSELSDKTQDMEDASKQFLENIKKLKEKQQSSWW